MRAWVIPLATGASAAEFEYVAAEIPGSGATAAFSGRTENMRSVHFPGKLRLLGQFVDIEMTDAGSNSLNGQAMAGNGGQRRTVLVSVLRKRLAGILRRCALGILLATIALLGVMGFRRAALTDAGLVMSTPAWPWLIGATVVGVSRVMVLLRELHSGGGSARTGTSVSRDM